jgi:hypothetical protein
LTSKKKTDSELPFSKSDIERAIGSTGPIRPSEEASEASYARMTQLLVEASTHLRAGLLFRKKREMAAYFKCMRAYKVFLSKQQDGPSIAEYVAKLARTPSPVELENRNKTGTEST